MWDERLAGTKSKVLIDGMHSLFKSFHSFLNLAVRQLDKGTCFCELLVHVGPFFSVTLIHMQLQPFGDQLKLMPEPFSHDPGVTFRIRNIRPQRFGHQLKLLPEPFGEDVRMTSRIGDIISKRCGSLLMLPTEAFSEILRMVPRFSNIRPHFLSQFV